MTEKVQKFREIDGTMGDIDKFNGMVRALERAEMRRSSSTPKQARKFVVRQLGIAAVSLENFKSLRRKIVPHWLMTRVRSELLSALESEAKNLEHEIHLHRTLDLDLDPDALAAAETQLAATRKLLTGKPE